MAGLSDTILKGSIQVIFGFVRFIYVQKILCKFFFEKKNMICIISQLNKNYLEKSMNILFNYYCYMQLDFKFEHNITKILLKVALNTITITSKFELILTIKNKALKDNLRNFYFSNGSHLGFLCF